MSNAKWDAIAEQLLASIEAGRPPWQRDWKADGAGVSHWPANALTGRPYRGANAMILLYMSSLQGWADLRFLTFNQARKAGGCVRKGESGTHVFLFRPMVRLPTPLNGKTVWPADDPQLLAAWPRRLPAGTERFTVQSGFTVFNVSQVDGLPSAEPVAEAVEPAPEGTDPQCAKAHQLARLCAGSVLVRHGSDTPRYAPSVDLVTMPERRRFETQSGYYAALFHEFVHASGHRNRLDRESGPGGSVEYAIEELVAESGAAFVTASVGLDYQSRHADYLASWCRQLRDTYPKPADVLMRAFGAGQKAADCVLAGLPSRRTTDLKAA